MPARVAVDDVPSPAPSGADLGAIARQKAAADKLLGDDTLDPERYGAVKAAAGIYGSLLRRAKGQ